MLISRTIALGLTCALLASPVAGAQDRRPAHLRYAAAAEPRGLRSPDTSIGSPGLETNPMNPPTISTHTSMDRPTSAPLDVGDSGSDWPLTTFVAAGFGLAVLAVALGAAARGRRKVVA